MADENLRKELFYMVRLTSKYDFTKMEVVEGILRLENERQILGSAFGKRFKERIFDIAAGQSTADTCVICGLPADNHVICGHCMETIGGSDYAKGLLKEEPAKKHGIKLPSIKFPSINLPSIKIPAFTGFFKYIILFCLTLFLCIQLWILHIWVTLPDYNELVVPEVSAYDKTPVASVEEGLAQLQLDFPEEKGFTVYYNRTDKEYVGRFLINPGECCLEVEDTLTQEERYDYFFTEETYVYNISYKDSYSAMQAIAKINSEGAIIILGTFDDGRRTDSFYKFR